MSSPAADRLAKTVDALLGDVDVDEQIGLVKTLSRKARAEVGAPIEELEGLAESALRKIKGLITPTPAERNALELAVRMLRPILTIENGEIPSLAGSVVDRFPSWSELQAAGPHVTENVARLDGRRFGEVAMAEFATAFAVTESLALTNAHVVSDLSLGVRELVDGEVTLQFGAENGLDRIVEPSPVREVVGVHPDLDIAVLRFDPGPGTRATGLALGSSAADLDPLAVVGFPQADRRNPAYLQSAIPMNEPVFKRAAPGIVRETRSWGLIHDASTLGGNSGSPVLRLQDLAVVAVHNGGGYRSGNDAQGIGPAATFLEKLGVPVP